jgi:activator of HSP90 ATPase
LFNNATKLAAHSREPYKYLENSAMQPTLFSRRALGFTLAALPIALVSAAETPAASKASAAADGLSHDAEAIRQEITLDASPQRVYQALTSTQEFDRITRLSDGAALLNAAGAKPTSISSEVGGAFILFGGYVTGRHVEMLPGERLVQAWHAGSWKSGEFSIAAFNLTADGGKTKLNFEHRGFPNGNGVSLAHGWHAHYWEPLAKFLAQA